MPMPDNIQTAPSGLRTLQHVFTTHDPMTKKAIILKTERSQWQTLDNKGMYFNVTYTTSSFPVDLNNDTDLKQHEILMNKAQIGLVNPGGTVCRFVDFAPGYTSFMHRTQSLDFGVVINGTIMLTVDSGETIIMEQGDVAIQRGTNHTWTNPSGTEWTRVMYVLQDARQVKIGGEALNEYHDKEIEGIPLSGSS